MDGPTGPWRIWRNIFRWISQTESITPGARPQVSTTVHVRPQPPAVGAMYQDLLLIVSGKSGHDQEAQHQILQLYDRWYNVSSWLNKWESNLTATDIIVKSNLFFLLCMFGRESYRGVVVSVATHNSHGPVFDSRKKKRNGNDPVLMICSCWWPLTPTIYRHRRHPIQSLSSAPYPSIEEDVLHIHPILKQTYILLLAIVPLPFYLILSFFFHRPLT